jgi:hypothetical protein
MYGAFEGDLVRPLGFVTLHAAYAEGELDELLSVLAVKVPYDNTKRQWTVGRKLSYAQRLVRDLKSPDLTDLQATLKDAKALFEQRNELVHGRLFSGGRLVSNRVGQSDRRVSQEDVVRLAEQLFNWKERLWLCRCRHVLPLLSSLREQNDA